MSFFDRLSGIGKLGPFVRIWTLRQPFIWAGLGSIACPFVETKYILCYLLPILLTILSLMISRHLMPAFVIFFSLLFGFYSFFLYEETKALRFRDSKLLPNTFSGYMVIQKLSRNNQSGTAILTLTKDKGGAGFLIRFMADDDMILKPGAGYFADFKKLNWNQPQHPVDFDEKKYFHSIGCYTKVRLMRIQQIDASFSFLSWRTEVKSAFLRLLQEVFEKNAVSSVFALITGDKKYFDPAQISYIRDAGLLHLFAVSGFHIGIIFAFFIKLFSFFRAGRFSVFPAIILVWLYIFLIGFPVSALRAGLMLSAALWGLFYGRPILSWGNFWLSFFLISAISPDQLSAPGFLLSFSALAGILIFLPTITVHLNTLKANSLPRIILYFISIFEISVAAQLGVLLPATYWFGGMNLLSPLVNIFAAPLIVLLIPAGLIPLILFPFFSSLTPYASIPGNLISNLVLRLSEFSSTFSVLFDPWYYQWVAIPLFLIILGKYWSRRLWLLTYLNYGLMILLLLFLLFQPIRFPVEIIQMNVGQGDAAMIECDGSGFLVDSGFRKKRFGRLIKNITQELDMSWAAITHGDSDHYGGMLTLESVLGISQLFVSSYNGGKWYTKMLAKYRHKKIPVEVPDIGIIDSTPYMRIYCIDNGRIGNKLGWDKNNSSLILLIITREWSYLMTGDAEFKQEHYLKSWYPLIKNSILKVGHHGSRKSASDSLLDECQPSLAIISCGKNNRYDHPHKKLLNRLAESGTKVFRTDLSGYWISPPLEFSIIE